MKRTLNWIVMESVLGLVACYFFGLDVDQAPGGPITRVGELMILLPFMVQFLVDFSQGVSERNPWKIVLSIFPLCTALVFSVLIRCCDDPASGWHWFIKLQASTLLGMLLWMISRHLKAFQLQVPKASGEEGEGKE